MPGKGHCPSWGLLPTGRGRGSASSRRRGLTLTSAERGTRQRRVRPWKSGGAPTSTSQGSRGASPGGLATPGSAGGDGPLPTRYSLSRSPAAAAADGQLSRRSAPTAAPGGHRAREGSPGRCLCHRGHAGGQWEQAGVMLLTSAKEAAGNNPCL